MSSKSLIQELMSGGKEKTAAPVDTSSLTDPVFVEKLASAVDFISDNLLGLGVAPKVTLVKKADAEVVPAEPVLAPVADLQSRLRASLQAKIQEKQNEETAADSELVNSVMGKLLRLRTEEPADKVAPVMETEQEESAGSSEPEETEVKAASVEDLTLADVLNGALRANELEETVPQEQSKTASVRGKEGPKARKAAVESLKQGLLAKFGKEA